MRINKLFSNYGICSRKETNKLIEDKRVIVNGVLCKPGQWVEEYDEILLDGERVKPREKIYIASADFMTRNTVKRVEVATPVYSEKIKKRIRGLFDLMLSDNKKARTEAALSDGEIILGGGHMTVPQLEALLNTLPIEITFVDDNNINRFFNEGPKVFKRPQMAIDREVFSCHPPKIEAMVRAILDDFRNNKRDRVPVWMEKNGKPFLVTYMAVRDKKGNYLGTVEVVQDMQFAKEHFEQ